MEDSEENGDDEEQAAQDAQDMVPQEQIDLT